MLYCFYITYCSCATESQAYESVIAELVVPSATDSHTLLDALIMADGGRKSFPVSVSESEHTQTIGKLIRKKTQLT